MDKIEPYGIPVVVDKSMKPMDVSLIRLPESYDTPFGRELQRYMNAVMGVYMDTLMREITLDGETAAHMKAEEAAQRVKDEWDFAPLREAAMKEEESG